MLFNRATGTSASVTDQIFNHTYITLRHFPGWVTSAALVLSAVGPTALAFVAVVGRARRSVDFACTLLVSHLIATSLHSGFPVTPMWWVLNVLAAAGLATVAEALSMRVELREIAVRADPADRRAFKDDDIEAGRTDDATEPDPTGPLAQPS